MARRRDSRLQTSGEHMAVIVPKEFDAPIDVLALPKVEEEISFDLKPRFQIVLPSIKLDKVVATRRPLTLEAEAVRLETVDMSKVLDVFETSVKSVLFGTVETRNVVKRDLFPTVYQGVLEEVVAIEAMDWAYVGIPGLTHDFANSGYLIKPNFDFSFESHLRDGYFDDGKISFFNFERQYDPFQFWDNINIDFEDISRLDKKVLAKRGIQRISQEIASEALSVGQDSDKTYQFKKVSDTKSVALNADRTAGFSAVQLAELQSKSKSRLVCFPEVLPKVEGDLLEVFNGLYAIEQVLTFRELFNLLEKNDRFLQGLGCGGGEVIWTRTAKYLDHEGRHLYKIVGVQRDGDSFNIRYADPLDVNVKGRVALTV